MPAQTLYTTSGQTFRRGKFIAKGGEGEIYAVQNHTQFAIKLYFPNKLLGKEEKIQEIIPYYPDSLRKFGALPIESLYDSRNNFVGFLMDFVKAEKLPYVYWQKERNEIFPKARWNFLIRVASNVARAVNAMHQNGFVIGDLNESNFLVFSDKEKYGTVKFIDCDSFQFQSGNQRFLCDVGKKEFTAPELQGKSLKVWRETNQDNFSLAVLIFQILFLGRHPFSGIPAGNKHFEVEQSIKEHRFAFGADSKTRGYLPPPYTTHLEETSNSIEQLFRRAFLQDKMRPTAKDWADSLEDLLERNLTVCEENNGHYYPNSLSKCPWCRIENESQWKIIHFDPVSFDTEFILDELWRKILSIKPPSAPLALSGKAEYSLVGWQKIKAQINSYSITKTTISLTLLLAFSGVVLFALNSEADLAIATIIIGGLACLVVIAVISNPQMLIPQAIVKEKKELESNYLYLVDNYGKQNALQVFRSSLEELQKKKDEYQNLGLFRAQRLQTLENQARARQEEEFLSKYRISNASIPNIGYSRTVTLGTYGIETAADLSWQKIYRVPGFGTSLASNLMGWREILKSRFTFNQTQAITESDKHALEREIYRKKTILEKELKNGLKLLQNVTSQSESINQSIYQNIEKTQEKLITLEHKFSPIINRWLKITASIYLIVISAFGLIIPISQKARLKQENASVITQSSNVNRINVVANQTLISNNQNVSTINSNLLQNTQTNVNTQESKSVVNYKEGISHTKAGRFAQAVESYQKAIELNPQYAEAYHELGYALFKLGKYNESLEASVKAAKLRPKNAETYRNLGDTYKALNQIDKACENYTQAKNLLPKHFQTITKLANCFIQQGDSESAINTYNDLVKIQPNNAVAHYELGKLYNSLSRSEEAMDEYTKLLKLNNSLAEKLLKEIEQ